MSDLVSFLQWTILANLIGLLMVIMCCIFLLYFQIDTNIFHQHSNSQKRYLVNFVQMKLFEITSIWPNLIEWLPLSWLCLILVPILFPQNLVIHVAQKFINIFVLMQFLKFGRHLALNSAGFSWYCVDAALLHLVYLAGTGSIPGGGYWQESRTDGAQTSRHHPPLSLPPPFSVHTI